MNERKHYSIELNGERLSVPDPMIISQEALRINAAKEKNTGMIVVYDPDTQAGGILISGVGKDPYWNVCVPVSQGEFADKVSGIINRAYESTSSIH